MNEEKIRALRALGDRVAAEYEEHVAVKAEEYVEALKVLDVLLEVATKTIGAIATPLLVRLKLDPHGQGEQDYFADDEGVDPGVALVDEYRAEDFNLPSHLLLRYTGKQLVLTKRGRLLHFARIGGRRKTGPGAYTDEWQVSSSEVSRESAARTFAVERGVGALADLLEQHDGRRTKSTRIAADRARKLRAIATLLEAPSKSR